MQSKMVADLETRGLSELHRSLGGLVSRYVTPVLRWAYFPRVQRRTYRTCVLRRAYLPEREREREFFIDNLLVRIHFIIMMIRWTGLAPWEFEFPFPGSLTSAFLGGPITREF